MNNHAAPSTTKPRLLVVEDNVLLTVAIERLLKDEYEVTLCHDGARAAEILVSRAFDVVLADVGLPGMSGLDLIRVVRTYDLEVPVVIMTGDPNLETAVEALNLGAFGYVLKPVTRETMIDALDRAVKFSRMARMRRQVANEGLGSPLSGERAALHTALDRALEHVGVAYQPIVDRRTKKVAAYEALMRPADPGMPTPGAVLEAAERLNRLSDVGRRMRELAAESFQPTNDDVLLFVNLHPADLLDPDLYMTGSPLGKIADHVVLEVTERAAFDEVTDTRHRAAELRRRGFRLALDDLGAGYAGLNSFAALEPEVVKLDMALIRGIEHQPVQRRIVESMTLLARDLGTKVVAEGVETHAELAELLSIGVDYLQGFLLGKPGPGLVTKTINW